MENLEYPFIAIILRVVPIRATSMGQIDLFNHLTVCKQMISGLFKMLPKNYSFTNHIADICIKGFGIKLSTRVDMP